MPGVFANGAGTQVWAGGFQANGVLLRVGGLPPALVQSVNLTFNQQVTPTYEIGTTNVYYIHGRAQGQLGAQEVLGLPQSVNGFWNLLPRSGCLPNHRVVTLKARNCTVGQRGSTTARVFSPLVTSIGVNTTSQGVVVTDNVNAVFLDMEMA